MKKLKNYFKGFTLVELIIVITILAILATIAFISFQNYTRDARDANRTATIKNIEKGLELFTIKTGNFPAPDESTPFTGWLDWKVKINQWIVWDNVARVINMNTIPLDPNDKSKYTYSTFWDDNKYYQVAINAENTQTSFIPQALAYTPISAIVKWNYRFDPSLPSLIVVKDSVNTASWIFDPKVCFVIDGWKNSLSSSSWSCIEKEDMSLKDFDSSLVGYWDMESLCKNSECWEWNNGKLMDLSGNGNHWTWSWWIVIWWTWGLNWKATYFDWTNPKKIIVDYFTWTSLQIKWKELTLIALVKQNNNLFTNQYSMILRKENMYHLYTEKNTWWIWEPYYTFSQNTNSGWTTPIINNYPAKFNEFTLLVWRVNFNNQTYDFFENWIKIKNERIQNYWASDFNQAFERELVIWWRKSTDWWEWNWLIDDVKIYNRALSDEEIRQQAKIAGFN